MSTCNLYTKISSYAEQHVMEAIFLGVVQHL